MDDFRSPRWLPGGHAQTIWPVFFSRRFDGSAPALRRERWSTPDGDFVDVDWLGEDRAAPLLVLFHGLEGSSASHYAQAFAGEARRRGHRFAVPHFRGCSGELNLAPRAYHSGDYEEIGWMLERFRSRHDGPIVAVGVSLGGNALLRFAEEAGASAARSVRALAAVSAPLDLAAGGAAIGRGFARQVYTRMFLRTMKPKALRKLVQHPGLFDRARLEAARDLRDFDDVFTAPLHGFADADRLLPARLGAAGAGVDPRPDARPQRPQRSLPAGAGAADAGRGGAPRHALAAGARRPRRLRERRLAGPRAHGSRAGRRLARGAPLTQNRSMDALVEAGLRKWPNVPHCYGWLGLDARGDWYLRDDATQAAGPFPQVKGSRIEHETLRGFIARNYAADAAGCWFFQNGPQRVYVELEAAPWVWRLQPGAGAPGVMSHTGRAARPTAAFLDESGRLFLAADIGPGLVHTLDMELAAQAVESGAWRPEPIRFDALVERFGYRLHPTRA